MCIIVLCVGRLCGTNTLGSVIDTAAKRAKLAPRKNPYWQGVSGGRGGVSLGYRKIERGPGRWIAKIAIDGARIEERIGDTDDENAASDALTFPSAVSSALDWGRRQYATIEALKDEGLDAKIPTVGSAVESYIKIRKQKSSSAGANAESRLTLHVLSDSKLSSLRLGRLRATTLEDWRSRLSSKLAPASVNRLMSDLRAALNRAAERYRRELPAYISAEIKIGTKAISVSTEARRQLLSDAQVKALVEAAFAVDFDFGVVVLLAAVTGARFSQLTALKIEDVQRNRLRILVPRSKKGRNAKARPPIAVPLSADVIHRLAPAIEGRNSDEPLLMRWAYRNIGAAAWEKDHRRPWGPAYEVEKSWALTIARVAVPPNTVMYALRHSSIVRGLSAGLPIRLVAALHDTSVEMIEKHYAAFIVDATEDLARRVTMSFAA
jgi:integrase